MLIFFRQVLKLQFSILKEETVLKTFTEVHELEIWWNDRDEKLV